MSEVKFESQLSVPVKPTEQDHVVRLDDYAPYFLTKDVLKVMEDPPDSGLYPALAHKHVVITDEDTAVGAFSGMVPDYTRIETTNRMPTEASTWTADRVGFVRCVGNYYIKTSQTGGTNLAPGVKINNRTMYLIISGVNPVIGSRVYFSEIFPVVPGDVITYHKGSFASDWGTGVSESDYDAYTEAYFIPPKIASVYTPTVSEDFMNVAMVPDYANRENNDLLGLYNYTIQSAGQQNPDNTKSFTADRNGFLVLYGNYYISQSAADNFVWFQLRVNGVVIQYWVSNNNDPLSRVAVNGIYPIKAGDVISGECYINGTSATNAITYIRSYFAPPKFVTTQAPNIVISGASYSEQEQATGETWIDGKTIYRRAFSGVAVVASNTYKFIELMAGVDSLVRSGGWLKVGDAKANLGHAITTETTTFYSSIVVHDDGTLELQSKSNSDRTSSNNEYQIWAEYTKA